MKKSCQLVLAGVLAVTVAGCAHQKKGQSMASAQLQQPDHILFDRSMQKFAQKKYDVAIIMLHTLMTAYPDSQYIERAELALNECSRLPECADIRAQIKALPNGGGITFLSKTSLKGR